MKILRDAAAILFAAASAMHGCATTAPVQNELHTRPCLTAECAAPSPALVAPAAK